MVDDDLDSPPAPPGMYLEEKKNRKSVFLNFLKKKKSEAKTTKQQQSDSFSDELPPVPESPSDSKYKEFMKDEKILKKEGDILGRVEKKIEREEEKEAKKEEAFDLDDLPLPPIIEDEPEKPAPQKTPKPKIKSKQQAKKKLAKKKTKKEPAEKPKKEDKQIPVKEMKKVPIKDEKKEKLPLKVSSVPVIKQKQAMPVKKPKQALKPKPIEARKIRIRVLKPKDELDEEIEKYFAKMEKEQVKLKKELDKIVPGIKPLKLETGESVSSLKQLKEAIEKLDKETFEHHIEHNDFYKWVRDILKEEELAESLRSKIIKKDVLLALKQHEDSIRKTIQSKEMKILQDKRFRQGLIKELQSKIEELHDLAVSLAKKDKLLQNKQKHINDRVKEATKDKLDIIDMTRKNLEAQQAKLQEQNKNLEKEKTEFSKKQADFLKQQSDFSKAKKEATRLFEEVPKIKQKKKEIEQKERDFKKTSDAANQRLNRWEASLKKEQGRLDNQRKIIEEHLKQKKKIEDYFKSIEDKLKKDRVEVDSKGFQAYLKGKLKEIGQIDLEEKEREERPAVKGGTYFEIYQKIDQCRSLIDSSKLEDAKKLYKEIKDEFYKARLSDKEKPILYNAIRELYDDIHLAVLEQS